MKNKSEFGRGLAYNLGLFLAHERSEIVWSKERVFSTNINEFEMWFNGASDHLYQLEIPKKFSLKLKKRIKLFQHKCLNWGHGFGLDGWKYGKPDRKKYEWALSEARSILREIDKSLKINSEKGEWE